MTSSSDPVAELKEDFNRVSAAYLDLRRQQSLNAKRAEQAAEVLQAEHRRLVEENATLRRQQPSSSWTSCRTIVVLTLSSIATLALSILAQPGYNLQEATNAFSMAARYFNGSI